MSGNPDVLRQTAEQVADGLNEKVTAESVRAARRRGQLASVRIGNEHFHTPEQVEAWLESITTTSDLITGRSRRALGRAS